MEAIMSLISQRADTMGWQSVQSGLRAITIIIWYCCSNLHTVRVTDQRHMVLSLEATQLQTHRKINFLFYLISNIIHCVGHNV